MRLDPSDARVKAVVPSAVPYAAQDVEQKLLQAIQDFSPDMLPTDDRILLITERVGD